MSRKNGTTTRIIDEAVQKLFKYGKIHFSVDPIDDRAYSFDEISTWITDVENNLSSQTWLFNKVLKRLECEHPKQFSYSSIDRTIKLIRNLSVKDRIWRKYIQIRNDLRPSLVILPLEDYRNLLEELFMLDNFKVFGLSVYSSYEAKEIIIK